MYLQTDNLKKFLENLTKKLISIKNKFLNLLSNILIRIKFKSIINIVSKYKDIILSLVTNSIIKMKTKFSVTFSNIRISLIQKKIIYDVTYRRTRRKILENVKSVNDNIRRKISESKAERDKKVKHNSFLKNEKILHETISNHVDIHNVLSDLLQIVYGNLDFEVSKLISEGYLVIRVDSKEFIEMSLLFIERFKVLVGINVYETYVRWWGSEEMFLEYITSWLYRRIAAEFRVISETAQLNNTNEESL